MNSHSTSHWTSRTRHAYARRTRATINGKEVTSRDYFDFEKLKEICEMHERGVGDALGMETVKIDAPALYGEDYYYFKDNGSKILAVAHLDTVVDHDQRQTGLLNTADGDVVYSGALDDRLGAYVLSSLLPSMGLTFDLLLTVGEESGRSTAMYFEPGEHHDKQYNWIIEFDRGGTDVVLYQYEDEDLVEMVEDTGVDVNQGAFSDISFMESIGIKALNWGVGYRDYHGPRGHVWLDDLYLMVDAFIKFHETWKDTHLPHEKTLRTDWWGSSRSGMDDDDEYDDTMFDEPITGECEAKDWNVGPCCTTLTTRPGYDVLCVNHAEWSDNV